MENLKTDMETQSGQGRRWTTDFLRSSSRCIRFLQWRRALCSERKGYSELHQETPVHVGRSWNSGFQGDQSGAKRGETDWRSGRWG